MFKRYIGKRDYRIFNWNVDICDDFANKLYNIVTTHDSIILLWNLQKTSVHNFPFSNIFIIQ